MGRQAVAGVTVWGQTDLWNRKQRWLINYDGLIFHARAIEPDDPPEGESDRGSAFRSNCAAHRLASCRRYVKGRAAHKGCRPDFVRLRRRSVPKSLHECLPPRRRFVDLVRESPIVLRRSQQSGLVLSVRMVGRDFLAIYGVLSETDCQLSRSSYCHGCPHCSAMGTQPMICWAMRERNSKDCGLRG